MVVVRGYVGDPLFEMVSLVSWNRRRRVCLDPNFVAGALLCEGKTVDYDHKGETIDKGFTLSVNYCKQREKSCFGCQSE